MWPPIEAGSPKSFLGLPAVIWCGIFTGCLIILILTLASIIFCCWLLPRRRQKVLSPARVAGSTTTLNNNGKRKKKSFHYIEYRNHYKILFLSISYS